ncbi:glycosyltransferase family 4 protein [Cruoricaptor ignavus]|uniref:glycosyltransferase family 4 protein n=1 Tax=Cruoricaptor ignavus TaxID=1118202 RepID=UPI00370DA56E
MQSLDILLESGGMEAFIIKLLISVLSSFLISFYTIPTIIKISRRKNLMDEPGLRSSHVRKIPNLGGIAIVYAICISGSIFAFELFHSFKFLFASIIILLFIGVMDDIVVMRAYKKLIAQLVVSALIVLGSGVRIRSFFGLFGVYEIPYLLSVFFSVAVFVAIINAFNLIDGIDGLSGSYAVLCCLFFGISFFRLGQPLFPLVIFCAVIIGAVSAFLYYNLSNRRSKKIFMGDTGSMVLGFLLAFTAVNFIDIFIKKDLPGTPNYHLQTAPVIAVAILILPIIDTLVVMLKRLREGKGLFEPDRNHIHHKMLRLGFTHRRSTFYIILYYLSIVGLTYLLRHMNVNLLLMIILALGFIGAYLPEIALKLRKKNS